MPVENRIMSQTHVAYLYPSRSRWLPVIPVTSWTCDHMSTDDTQCARGDTMWHHFAGNNTPQNDISPTSGSVYFVSHESRQILTINILPDDEPEGPEVHLGQGHGLGHGHGDGQLYAELFSCSNSKAFWGWSSETTWILF